MPNRVFVLEGEKGNPLESTTYGIPSSWAVRGHIVKEYIRRPETHNLTPNHYGQDIALCECERMELKGYFVASLNCLKTNRSNNKLFLVKRISKYGIRLMVSHRGSPFNVGDYVLIPKGRYKTTRYQITSRTEGYQAEYIAVFAPRLTSK